MAGRVLRVLCAVLAVSWPSAAWAQAARPGRLVVTVVDPLGGVIPEATVTITGLETATRKVVIPPAKTSDRGVATIEGLVPGRYSLTAEFSGFELKRLDSIRVRAGDNRQTMALTLRHMEDAVTVGGGQEAASDRSATFGTALTREQLELLSDDPTEMRNQLMAVAGDPNAVIRVDSFEGQELPPKAMIKSVRITRDQFAAENHYAGGISIEIITQPGAGPLRGSVRLGYYDSALDGKNPLIGQRGPGRQRNFGGNLSGSLLKDRASFNLSLNGSNNYSTPFVYGSDAGGVFGRNLNIRTPSTSAGFSGSIDYAITKDQTIRTGFGHSNSRTDNLGAGGSNLADRVYGTRSSYDNFRIQEVGPLGRRFFTNTRFSLQSSDTSSNSVLEAQTIVINGARTFGGAQRSGGTRNQNYSLYSDLDYVRGRHAFRAGLALDGSHYHSDANSDYLGTYTFQDEAAYQEARPQSFSRRIGDPNIEYWYLQAGLYLQDDIKISKGLTLTPGVRYELQTHLHDRSNVQPRFGITWAPFKSGRTTLRASAGVFGEWLNTGTYEQSLRVDGFRQQSVNISDPAYPDPGPLTAAPTDRYVLGPGLKMPRTARVSAGVSQRLGTRFSVGTTYAYSRGSDLFVGRNLNAPVDGVRPDVQFANVIEVTSAGRSRQQTIGTNVSVDLSKPSDRANTRFFVPTRSLQAYAYYSVNFAKDDTGGPFSVPSTGNLADDWGPSNNDVRHNVTFGMNTGLVRNLSASLYVYASSARPLTITTGLDDNGDLIFNDRPAGLGRNSARTSGQWNSSANFNYSIALGKRQISGSGVSISSVNGVLSANAMTQAVPRYRVIIGVSIQNLTNHANYSTYNGVMNSPLFLQPIFPQGVRTVRFNLGLSF
jgi:hypothetical protein